MDNPKVNTLFAFLLALQELNVSPQEDLLVKLRHKINHDGFKDWENIQEKLESMFQKVPDLRTKYKDLLSRFGNAFITSDLRLMEAFGLPDPPDKTFIGTQENVLKATMKTVLENLSDRRPLQPLRDSLEKQSQNEPHQQR